MPIKVRFTSCGVVLRGLLFLPGANRPLSSLPGVIVCHGLGSRKENHADFGEFIRSRGFACLVFDLRGHGQSGGSLDGNVLEDFRAAIAFLKERREIDASRMAIRGSSLGGHLAIHAGASFQELRAVVAICPAPEEVLHSRLVQAEREIPVSERPPDLRINLPDFLSYLESRDICSAATRIAPRALLLVHARGDDVIPYTYTERIYHASGEPKDMVLLDDGSHTSAQHDPQVHDLVARWLEVNLNKK